MVDVVVIGGGLAGLVNSILLSRAGVSVTLIEKKSYPFHRVCGEYVSNEVIPFLEANDLYPHELNPVPITRFKLSSIGGRSFEMDLDLGGFGISRFDLDHWLYLKAVESGVKVLQNTTVRNVEKIEGSFLTETGKEGLTSKIVVGAFGKKSNVDVKLKRNFTNRNYPFIGVKYHIRTEEVEAENIELHNFPGGYCGVSKVSNETFNLCYLSNRNNLKDHGDIDLMEESVLYQNPRLKGILRNSEKLFKKPEVINEVTFYPKQPVEKHILMIGDAAGMITPLCGNGMAMAIHSGALLSRLIIKHLCTVSFNSMELQDEYEVLWRKKFSKRQWAGRKIQSMLFGAPISSSLAIGIGKWLPPVARFLMSKTHGEPFQ